MTGKKKSNYQNTINNYIAKKEQFIDHVRTVFSQQDADSQEKEDNLETFNALLLKATYAEMYDLEAAFQECFHSLEDPMCNYISAHCREINGFCNQTFSDEHEGYQNIYGTLTFLTPDIKESIREQLSKKLTEMILEKTDQNASKPDIMQI